MCCEAEVFCVWVNFISVRPHTTQIQVLCLLFPLIKLLWLRWTTAQFTGFRWLINCAIRSGYGQYKKDHWNWILCDGYVYYWSDCFVFEIDLINWNYWVIRGQNLWWGRIMRSILGVMNWNIHFLCSIVAYSHSCHGIYMVPIRKRYQDNMSSMVQMFDYLNR